MNTNYATPIRNDENVSDLNIERNVPIPMPGDNANKTAWRKAMERMNVGDSFQVPPGMDGKINSARATIQKQDGYRFTIRKFQQGYRCWRTA